MTESRNHSDKTERVNDHPIWLHRFARIVAAATFLLIVAGGLVTSTGSGLSVPDWPTTYGYNMFLFPVSKWVGGIRFEHTHRLIASAVGLLTLVLTVLILWKEPRRSARWIAGLSLLTVILQGVLGGVTVLHKLPVSISVLHGCLAQTFFCLVVALMVMTAPEWRRTIESCSVSHTTRRLCLLTTAAIYMQLILGAVMRHSGSGLAIPDFPLSFGHVVPPDLSGKIAINYAHRVGAAVVTIMITWVAVRLLRNSADAPALASSAISLVCLLLLQLTLAALTVWTQKNPIITTAHVATGALLLAASLGLTLRSYRLPQAAKSELSPGLLVERAL